MSNRDLEYYQRRAQQEREHAERADDKVARLVHLEMAKRYSAMLADKPATPTSAQV